MERNRPLGWTTLEEAKRLVDVGLDPNTADMCYIINDETKKYREVPIALPYINYTAKKIYIPCWSLGALIELMPKFVQEKEIEFSVNSFVSVTGDTHIEYSSFEPEEVLLETNIYNPVEAVISMIRKLIENGYIKKSE